MAWDRGAGGQGTSWAWRKIRKQVLQRDNYECQLRLPGCVEEATEVDHIHSITAQGLSRAEAIDPDMCRAVCKPCHLKVTQQQSYAARRARKFRPSYTHPGDVA